jgi:hypothetical protein
MWQSSSTLYVIGLGSYHTGLSVCGRGHCWCSASFVAGLESPICVSSYARFPSLSSHPVLSSAAIFGRFSSSLDLVPARFDSMKGASIPLGHDALRLGHGPVLCGLALLDFSLCSSHDFACLVFSRLSFHASSFRVPHCSLSLVICTPRVSFCVPCSGLRAEPRAAPK